MMHEQKWTQATQKKHTSDQSMGSMTNGSDTSKILDEVY